MDLKHLVTVFGTVFLAELGDKTQLATVLFAAKNPELKWLTFGAAAAGLVCAAALGVLAGSFVGEHVDTRLLTRIAGAAFVIIGVWTFASA